MSSDTSNGKEALLRKLKALADRGETGEKENAAALLEKLMNKYGIGEEELEQERIEDYFFRYKEETEHRLLIQIAYMVTGKDSYKVVSVNSGRRLKEIAVKCTAAQKLEIEACYAFYNDVMKKELEIFYSAFAFKNRLFPPESLTGPSEEKELSSEKIKNLRRAEIMSMGMEAHLFHKQLSDGTI